MVPYRVIRASNGDVRIAAADKEYSPPEISAMILQKLRQAAEEYLAEFRRLGLNALPLAAGHEEACRIAQALLPEVLPAE